MYGDSTASERRFTILEVGRRGADKLLGSLLAAHFLLVLALAPLHDTWLLAIAVGLPVSIIAVALTRVRPGALVTRLAVSIGLMIYSALIIHQTHGSIEAHFHIFASLAFLLVYRDWRAPVAAATVIALHHVAFELMHAAGIPVFLMNHGHGMPMVLVHAAFVVAETAILVHMSIVMSREAADVNNVCEVMEALSRGEMDIDVPGTSAVARASRHLMQQLRALGDEAIAVQSAVARGARPEQVTQAEFTGGFATIFGTMVQTATNASGLMAAQRTEAESGTRFLHEVRAVAERINERDLTARIDSRWDGDRQRTVDSLNNALAQLCDALGEVRASADQVAGAASQIARGSDTLAQGTGQQASALEEVSANVKTLGQTSAQNARHAAEAQALADASQSSAHDGYAKMQHLLTAMADIKSSSESTARIVRTIDEIAFQTNLLALNAAVEAARAGDAGRGFAVVAEEVRALAKRSAEAARTTSQLIQESVEKVGHGEALTESAHAQLQDIQQRVTSMGHVITRIEVSSQEQRSGVSEIDRALEQVNVAVQQAAANADESASAAQELTAQSRSQLELVSSFRLPDQDAGENDERETPAVRRNTGTASRRNRAKPAVALV